MKNINIVSPFLLKLIVIAILFTSCNELFNDEDNSYILIDNENKQIKNLNGVYLLLAQVHGDYYNETLIRTDDINIFRKSGFT